MLTTRSRAISRCTPKLTCVADGFGKLLALIAPCLSTSMLVTEKSRLFGSPRSCARFARRVGKTWSAVAPVNSVGLKNSSKVPWATPGTSVSGLPMPPLK